MIINKDIAVTNEVLAKTIEKVKEYTMNYYGLEAECVYADDIVNYLNEFSKESHLIISVGE